MLHLVVVRIPPDGAAVRDWATFLTSAERGYAGSRLRADEHIAARIAARQAVLDVLGLDGLGPHVLGWETQPPWRSIEVVRGPAGEPRVSIGGEVEELRRSRGLAVPGISLSHAAGFAAAVAWLPEYGEAGP